MRKINFPRVKIFIFRHYSKLTFAVGIVLICFVACHHLLTQGKLTDSHSEYTQSVINSNYIQISSLCHQWLKSDNDSMFLYRLWHLGIPSQWHENKVSLYFFRNDTLLYWANQQFKCDVNEVLNSPSSGTFDTLDSKKVLIFRHRSSAKATAMVLRLQNVNDKKLNDVLFPNPDIRLHRVDSSGGKKFDKISVGELSFYVEPLQRQGLSIPLVMLRWLGILLVLLSIIRYMLSITNRSNVFRNLMMLLAVIALARVGFSLIGLTNSGLTHHFMHKTSTANLRMGGILVSFICMLLFVIYAYRVKNKLKWRYEHMTKRMRFFALVISITLINIIVVYFHVALVKVIYGSDSPLELHNIMENDVNTILFFATGCILIAIRIIFNNIITTCIRDYSGFFKVITSMVIITLLLLPLENQIRNSGYILLIFHLLFLVFTTSLRHKMSQYSSFLCVLAIFSCYISLFVVIESNEANRRLAKRYSTYIDQNSQRVSDQVTSQYLKFNYAILDHNSLNIQQGNSLDIQQLLPFINLRRDTVINIDNYNYYIQNTEVGRNIVVSYRSTSLLDFLSLFSYIYILVLLVTSLLLRVSGFELNFKFGWSSMAMKIRVVVIGIVFAAMVVLATVIITQSVGNHKKQNRIALNNTMQNLLHSFGKYVEADSTVADPLLMWQREVASNFNRKASIYDIHGKLIAPSPEFLPTNQIANVAFRNLKSDAPYFIQEVQIEGGNYYYLSAYSPVWWDGRLYGYLNVVDFDPLQSDAQVKTINSTINIFIIILLAVLVFSMIVYQRITKPLNRLNQGMQNIAQMKKIPQKEGAADNDEVETLIIQYNNMIDFLECSYRQLAISEREGAWREMARQVAHEIKNPLTPMKLKIQMLQRHIEKEDADIVAKTSSTLDTLLIQIDLLARIATAFSDFSKMEEGHHELLDLRDIIRNVHDLFAESCTIHLSINTPHDKPIMVMADRGQLTRVFVNICKNGLQALPENGEGYMDIVVSECPENKHVKIDISDNGLGIDPEIAEKIFEPNFTTKSGGSGLGLAISAQIIRNLGGTISFESVLCEGATFSIELPTM